MSYSRYVIIKRQPKLSLYKDKGITPLEELVRCVLITTLLALYDPSNNPQA